MHHRLRVTGQSRPWTRRGRTSVPETESLGGRCFCNSRSPRPDFPGRAVGARLRGSAWHAPAHIDAEVLSALGRLERAGRLNGVEAAEGLLALSELPIKRHAVSPLLLGAWTLRSELRLVDGLYVELARQPGMRLITTDQRLAWATSIAEVISW
jgi:predicted nucleic acid-binding protein